MTKPGFDREWTFSELLDSVACQKIGPAFAQLLGGDLAIVDAAGQIVWGAAHPDARREPLILELEPLADLLSNTASAAELAAARVLLQALLGAQTRFKMASLIHLDVVAEDFELLKCEHARLSESEARYKVLSEELETRMQKQVAELEARQQKLYQAEKLASVGQLAAGIAHEINNPLGFVRSNLSTFEKYLGTFSELKTQLEPSEVFVRAWQNLDLDFLIEDGSDLLHDCAQGLARITRIVADLKEFSNIDHASDQFSDLNISLRQAANIIEKQLPLGIALRFNLLPLPKIVGQPGHLSQLFFNILHNAMLAIKDAGRPGEITISSETNQEGILIRIHDDGIGMTPEQLEHAFDPFYTLRPVGTGVGLGLASARSIVLAHGGRIGLDSQPEVGTTVSLFFPVPAGASARDEVLHVPGPMTGGD